MSRTAITLCPSTDPSYSDAVMVGSTLYIAGQTGKSPPTGKLVSADFSEQTHQVWKNIGSILRQVGADYSDLVSISAYLLRPTDHDLYVEIRNGYVLPSRVATTTVMPRSLLGHTRTLAEPEPWIKVTAVAELDPARAK
jgi:enamine deaminase RidA (YjgF/YER057c/UK114 family)